MGCGQRQYKTDVVAWSGPSTSTTMFVISGPTLKTEDYESVKVDVESRNNTGDIKWNRAVMLGDDGITWDAAVTFDDDSGSTWISSDGFDYGSGFESISNNKSYFRIGIGARNVSGSDLECVRCTLTITLTPR